MLNKVYLGLGSNLGNREKNIKTALKYLEDQPEINLIKKSSFYETEPWGNTKQNKFINAACLIETSLDPHDLLKKIKQIEYEYMGRQKTEKWGPRIIDIDILLYEDKIINDAQLTIPHPHINEREFVLAPLQEIQNENNNSYPKTKKTK